MALMATIIPCLDCRLLPHHHGSADDGQRAVQGEHLVRDVDLGAAVYSGGHVSQVSDMPATRGLRNEN